MKLSRRRFSRWVLGAPLAAAASSGALENLFSGGAVTAAEEEARTPEFTPSPLSRFLSKQNPELSRADRRKIRRDITQLEQALQEIRDYPLGNEVPPSVTFRPMRSKRR